MKKNHLIKLFINKNIAQIIKFRLRPLKIILEIKIKNEK